MNKEMRGFPMEFVEVDGKLKPSAIFYTYLDNIETLWEDNFGHTHLSFWFGSIDVPYRLETFRAKNPGLKLFRVTKHTGIDEWVNAPAVKAIAAEFEYESEHAHTRIYFANMQMVVRGWEGAIVDLHKKALEESI